MLITLQRLCHLGTITAKPNAVPGRPKLFSGDRLARAIDALYQK
jgi:hypothetical protein